MSTSPTYLSPQLAARLLQFDPATQVPPPPELPTATLALVRQPGKAAYARFTPHATLVERLGLKAQQRMNLLPPCPGSSFWLLDLRPDVAPLRLAWTDRPRLNVPNPPSALLTAPLTLLLLPGEPYYPHVYPLLPASALTPADALAA